MTNLEVLKAARELLSEPKRWTQHATARTTGGIPTDPKDPNAITWDATGAIDKFCTSTLQVINVVGIVTDAINNPSMADLNDNHHHADVLAAFDKAIATLQADASEPTAQLFGGTNG